MQQPRLLGSLLRAVSELSGRATGLRLSLLRTTRLAIALQSHPELPILCAVGFAPHSADVDRRVGALLGAAILRAFVGHFAADLVAGVAGHSLSRYAGFRHALPLTIDDAIRAGVDELAAARGVGRAALLTPDALVAAADDDLAVLPLDGFRRAALAASAFSAGRRGLEDCEWMRMFGSDTRLSSRAVAAVEDVPVLATIAEAPWTAGVDEGGRSGTAVGEINGVGVKGGSGGGGRTGLPPGPESSDDLGGADPRRLPASTATGAAGVALSASAVQGSDAPTESAVRRWVRAVLSWVDVGAGSTLLLAEQVPFTQWTPPALPSLPLPSSAPLSSTSDPHASADPSGPLPPRSTAATNTTSTTITTTTTTTSSSGVAPGAAALLPPTPRPLTATVSSAALLGSSPTAVPLAPSTTPTLPTPFLPSRRFSPATEITTAQTLRRAVHAETLRILGAMREQMRGAGSELVDVETPDPAAVLGRLTGWNVEADQVDDLAEMDEGRRTRRGEEQRRRSGGGGGGGVGGGGSGGGGAMARETEGDDGDEPHRREVEEATTAESVQLAVGEAAWAAGWNNSADASGLVGVGGLKAAETMGGRTRRHGAQGPEGLLARVLAPNGAAMNGTGFAGGLADTG